jgi:hypothetical protein
MKHTETIAKLSEALSKAQGSIQGALRDRKNPFYNSKYSDLASIWKCAREPLAQNGLAVIQGTFITEDGKIILESKLTHLSGEWISSFYPVEPIKKDPQGLGSALTYARRYSLQSLLGICADDDDDGNAASSAPRTQVASPPPVQVIKPMPIPTPVQEIKKDTVADEVMKKISILSNGYKDEGRLNFILENLGVKTSKEIMALDDNSLLDMIAKLDELKNDFK